MKSSGIGGQAVLEGIMMRNGGKYAVAVRKPDKEIVIDVKNHQGMTEKHKFLNIPFVRGVFKFAESLSVGIKTLTYSASFFEDEEEDEKLKGKEKKKAAKKGAKSDTKKASENDLDKENRAEEFKESDSADLEEQKKKAEEKAKKIEDIVMALTVCFSVVLSVFLFIVLPFLASEFMKNVLSIKSVAIIAIVEGFMRIFIFLVYIVLISRMKDIQRTFMYHGAEHKCINCIEHGLPLTVENVKKSSRIHKRCGTSFLLFVVVISIISFILVSAVLPAASKGWLKLVVRLLLIPLIAGISFEILRKAGNSDGKIITAISKPGMWLQKLTTREPEDDMIEVGIASVEAVFDWKAYIKENFNVVVDDSKEA